MKESDIASPPHLLLPFYFYPFALSRLCLLRVLGARAHRRRGMFLTLTLTLTHGAPSTPWSHILIINIIIIIIIIIMARLLAARPQVFNNIYISGSAVFNRRCSLTGMIDIRHQSARQ
jgi:hypothetical protein